MSIDQKVIKRLQNSIAKDLKHLKKLQQKLDTKTKFLIRLSQDAANEAREAAEAKLRQQFINWAFDHDPDVPF